MKDHSGTGRGVQPPSYQPMKEFLTRVLPGSSPAVARLREQVLEFVSDPSAQNVLLRGPTGAGKTTVARVIALLRRVAPVKENAAVELLRSVPLDRSGRIDVRHLTHWYVELALTGLVETLADVQLFGSTKNAFTNATNQPGIFELAAHGRSDPDRIPVGAQVTGGVVFLDEIGDLPPPLQAKLLPVLSGAPFYRVGGEGTVAQSFHGTTITATWRELGPREFRSDLLSRIAGYVIHVPGLDERREDLPQLIELIAAGASGQLKAAIGNWKSDPDCDIAFWERWTRTFRPDLTLETRRALLAVDWSARGNMRALTNAIYQHVLGGRPIAEVIEGLPSVWSKAVITPPSDQPNLFERLMRRAPNGDGLASHVRELELEDRRELQELLRDANARQQLAEALGIPVRQLAGQVNDLGRERRNRGVARD